MSGGVIQIFYQDKQELHEGGRDTNVVLGAFVTCYGRMKLYEELQKLDDRVLYYDTDSIIFISKPNQYEPVLGDYLGWFTNEIKDKDGKYIIEFVSGGPKNYGYCTESVNTYFKVKGIASNYTAEQQLNFLHN